MSLPLFRPQVLNAKKTQWAGTIVLARPIQMKLAASVAGILTIALILFLAFGEYTRKVRVTGQIVPAAGTIKVTSPQYGRVITRLVAEGNQVLKGQVLYELSSERTNEKGGIDARIDISLAARRTSLAEETNLQTQQLQQREKALQSREELINAEIVRLAQEIILQATRVSNAENLLTRYRSLREQGFISDLQLGQIENDHIEQLARFQTLQRTELTLKRELLQAKNDKQEVNGQIQLNSARAGGAIATLEQEVAEHQGRNNIQVLAPTNGTATALVAELGQTVQLGVALATIIPTGSALEAHLLSPSRAIGFIEPGQSVLIRLTAFPYQKFGQIEGKVLRVENSPFVEANNTPATEPVYRVVVGLARQSITAYGKEHHFKAGMTLEADIRQDRRRLFEWVIDPILSVVKNR
jgi:membrane fusion protein